MKQMLLAFLFVLMLTGCSTLSKEKLISACVYADLTPTQIEKVIEEYERLK